MKERSWNYMKELYAVTKNIELFNYMPLANFLGCTREIN